MAFSRRAFVATLAASACARGPAQPPAASSDWTQLTANAGFPGSYNFPVHALSDGRFVALHPQGTWESRDGTEWTRTALAPSGLNSGYLGYVQHQNASWALGMIEGNYQAFTINSLIQRTSDYARWEALGPSPTLPRLIFYAVASFQNAMWMLGGFDGQRAVNDVWRSADGLAWTRMAQAPWSARSGAKAIVFRERLYLIGGGIIDGPQANDIWSSADGLAWGRETAEIAPERPVGYTPVAFDDKIWLIGANRSGTFSSEMLVSEDAAHWRAQTAPWSPRGGVAAWTRGDALYITGGKYSYPRNGEPVFVYSNDVWAMRRA